MLAWTMMERLRAGAPAPTEQEIQAFYARNAAAYGKPFQEVLPDVARRAAAEKGSRTLEARLKALREKARVEVYDDALKRAASRDA